MQTLIVLYCSLTSGPCSIGDFVNKIFQVILNYIFYALPFYSSEEPKAPQKKVR